MKTIIGIETCATGFGFIDEKFADTVSQRLEIPPQHFTKLTSIQRLDSKAAQAITYTIYITFSVGNYTDILALGLMTKLELYFMILGRPGIKK